MKHTYQVPAGVVCKVVASSRAAFAVASSFPSSCPVSPSVADIAAAAEIAAAEIAADALAAGLVASVAHAYPT